MNTIIKNSGLCLISLFTFISSYGQDLWPFRDAGNNVLRGNVTGTVGDFRQNGSGVRFHAGVDFTSPLTGESGKAVFSMHAGTVQINNTGNCWQDYIRIHLDNGQDVYYKHVRPASSNPVNLAATIPLTNGTIVQVRTFLGKMVTDNPSGSCNQHVHINNNSNGTTLTGTTNFINNFVHPFSDIQEPNFVHDAHE